MRTCIHVFLHELRKVISDRKLLGSIFLMPFIIVFITSFLSAGELENNTDQQVYHVYSLNNVMSQQKFDDGIEIVPVSYCTFDELTYNIELQPEDVVLSIIDGNVIVYYNSTNVVSQNLSLICKQMVTESILTDFAESNMVDISSRIVITDVNEKPNTDTSLATILFPYMLILLLFQSTSQYAMDTIAGEKERGVFSTLLLAPVSPTPVLSGKLLSSIVCGMFSTAVYILVSLGLGYITGNDTFGLQKANIAPTTVGLLVICALLISCFFASLSVLCSLYAKTVKEAQYMKLPVYGITMVLALSAMLRLGTVSHIHYIIPIYNICILMQDILSIAVDMSKMLLTVLSLTACTAAVVMFTAISFKKEKVRY